MSKSLDPEAKRVVRCVSTQSQFKLICRRGRDENWEEENTRSDQEKLKDARVAPWCYLSCVMNQWIRGRLVATRVDIQGKRVSIGREGAKAWDFHAAKRILVHWAEIWRSVNASWELRLGKWVVTVEGLEGQNWEFGLCSGVGVIERD